MMFNNYAMDADLIVDFLYGFWNQKFLNAYHFS